MINHDLRARGVGASEVACLVGCDDRRDAWSLFAEKTGLVEREDRPPTPRMKRGKFLEQGIVDWYADATSQSTEWSDTTVAHPTKTWLVVTPDAFVTGPERGGVDAKTSGLGMHDEWGDSGSDLIPTSHRDYWI